MQCPLSAIAPGKTAYLFYYRQTGLKIKQTAPAGISQRSCPFHAAGYLFPSREEDPLALRPLPFDRFALNMHLYSRYQATGQSPGSLLVSGIKILPPNIKQLLVCLL